MKKNINIFWTGGWDSTFRLVQLQMLDNLHGQTLEVTPIYVAGDGRNSEPQELKTMDALLPKIRSLNKMNTIKDLRIVNKASILPNQAITDAYNRISNKVRIGSQYEFLSRLAVCYPGIEIAIEKANGEFSGCGAAINTFGSLKAYNGTWVIDNEVSSNDLFVLLGNMEFPIITTTEVDMVKLIKSWNCEDVMRGIWFCHNPINNMPCGFCRPCQQKMECEMGWLLPKKGQERYFVYKRIASLLGSRVGTKISNAIFRSLRIRY